MRFGVTAQVGVVVFVPKAGPGDDGFVEGELLLPELDLRFPARSGPWGKGSLPVGLYHLFRPVKLDPTNVKAGFKDGKGQAWWAKLKPQFETERDGFGVHPDPDGPANTDGTAGCIGIVLFDTAPAYEAIRKLDAPAYCWVMSEPAEPS